MSTRARRWASRSSGSSAGPTSSTACATRSRSSRHSSGRASSCGARSTGLPCSLPPSRRPARSPRLGVTAAHLAELVELSNAIDAFADLQVAEATHGVVTGRPAAVAAAAEAAAGVGIPPEPGVIRTRRDGRTLDTTVAVVLPVPASAGEGPAAVAEPAVAAFLDERAGDPAGPAWQWTTLDDAGQPQGTVTLDDVGLRPCETVLLGIDQLRALAASVADAPSLAPENPGGPRLVRTWATAIAGSVNVGDDIAAAASVHGRPPSWRRDSMRCASRRPRASRRSEPRRHPPRPRRNAADARVSAARWGVVPHDTDDDVDRLVRAADALERRLAMSSVPPADAAPSAFAEAIMALIAPEGGWPVFARVPESVLAGTARRGCGDRAAARSRLAGGRRRRPARAGTVRGRSARCRLGAAGGVVQPARRPVADIARSRPAGGVRAGRRRPGATVRTDDRRAGRDRSLRRDDSLERARRRRRLPARPATGTGAAGGPAGGAAGRRRGPDDRHADRRHRGGPRAGPRSDGADPTRSVPRSARCTWRRCRPPGGPAFGWGVADAEPVRRARPPRGRGERPRPADGARCAAGVRARPGVVPRAAVAAGRAPRDGRGVTRAGARDRRRAADHRSLAGSRGRPAGDAARGGDRVRASTSGGRSAGGPGSARPWPNG